MLIEATTQTVNGHVYIVTGDDDLNVGAGVTIRSLDTDAVTTWAGQHSFTVSGSIIGYDECINTIGCNPAQTVTILSTGVLVSGGDGGVADADGVILDGVGSIMTNAGQITSYGSCASVFARDGYLTTIENSGTMTGRVAGVWHKFGSGTLEFTNTGTVTGTGHAYLGGQGSDRVFNLGDMVGLIDLGEGDDLYDGRGGTVAGEIRGGNGNDVFRPGSDAETIRGGAGTDLLDLSQETTGQWVRLSHAAGNTTGATLGDLYYEIENVTGTGQNDRILGDTAGNYIRGGAGLDQLYGFAGDDTLHGGVGRDTMAGGLGQDTFVFDTLADRGDFITDFLPDDDTIIIRAAALRMGYTGPLHEEDFFVGTAAQDAGDRFIFRTSDATLWYDRDGTGPIGLALIANLNDGILLTASDILLY